MSRSGAYEAFAGKPHAVSIHLYGLTREELDYIMETFPIVRRNDEERYGEYRTKRLVLEAYEALEGMV